MKITRLVAVVLSLALLAAACGDDDDTDTTADTTTETAETAEPTGEDATGTSAEATSAAATDEASATASDAAAAGSLVGICPDTIAIQTSWFPEVEYGGMYNLIGPDGDFDPSTGVYSGPLGDTGIEVEVRAGGPLSGNQQVTAQLYSDDSLFMGMLASDEQIQNSESNPTVAVMAYFDKDPQILFYDPATYDFETIAEIGETDATVLYFEGSTYMEYLVGSGQLKAEQIDGSYTGGSDRWITADGAAVQSGLLSSEPFRYEFETELWNKPVEPLLVFDSGYVNYASSLSMRPELVEEYAECLELFVPIMQQSTVDFFSDPGPVSDAITQMNLDIGDFWQTSPELNEYSIGVILERELVTNGIDGAFGTFDPARLQTMIDILTPIFEEANVPLKEGLAPEDLFTGEFLDPDIAF